MAIYISTISDNDSQDEIHFYASEYDVSVTVISEKAGQLDFSIDNDDWKRIELFVKQYHQISKQN